MGGGALSSNVSKLGSKEVSKKLRNFTLAIKKACHCEDERSEDVAIAKSLNINEITTQSTIARNDKYRHAEFISASQLHEKGASSRNNKTLSRISKFTSFTKKFNPLPEVEGKCAFTLAEVLITLGVIGVVASLTLPSVIERHQKLETVTKLKKVYSTLSQMEVSSFADNGYASDFLPVGNDLDAEKVEQFFNTYWFPYFKSPMVAKNNKSFYPNTQNADSYKLLNGSPSGMSFATIYKNGRVMFSTQDGTIYTVWIMNWRHNSDGISTAEYGSYYNVYVDINGVKNPNKFGKDVFKFKIWPEKNVVKPDCLDMSAQLLNINCGKTGNGECCAAKIMRDGWKISDDYPW